MAIYKLIILLLLFSTSLSAEVLETSSKLYDKKVQVIVGKSKGFRDLPNGVVFNEVKIEGEIGSPFFRKITFYFIDSSGSNAIFKEDNIFRVTGFLTKDVVEINEINITNQWEVEDQKFEKFKTLVTQISNDKLSSEQQIEVYNLLVNGFPFDTKAKHEKTGDRNHKWLIGDQLLYGNSVNIEKSIKYGNRFIASFVHKQLLESEKK